MSSLDHNSSVWLDTLDAWSWDRNATNFNLGLVSYRSAGRRHTSAREFIILELTYRNYILPYIDTRVLNSLEELCIMRAVAINSFARVINAPTPRWEHL